MMFFNHLLRLAKDAAGGIDNIGQGAIGTDGYGFVFRDKDYMEKYVEVYHSSKFQSLGSMREFMEMFKKDMKSAFKSIDDIDALQDVYLIGSIKTLVPTMNFGGPDVLFSVWVFIITPEGYRFPASLYYGPSRLAFGGWSEEKRFFDDQREFPKEFTSIINCNPFALSELELEELSEALELSLRKVPTTPFFGMHRPEYDYMLIGISEDEKKPYIVPVEKEYYTEKGLDSYITRYLNGREKLNIDLKKVKEMMNLF